MKKETNYNKVSFVEIILHNRDHAFLTRWPKFYRVQGIQATEVNETLTQTFLPTPPLILQEVQKTFEAL